MSDSENYALNAKPAIYTEAEMQQAKDDLETLKTDFNQYRTMMQNRRWNAERIINYIDHNVITMQHLQTLCDTNPIFADGYNHKQILYTLCTLTDDNISKIKALRESQE